MVEDIGQLLRGLGWRLGEVALNPVGALPHGKRDRQMVKRGLPDQADELFGGIEAERVHGSVREAHGDPEGGGNFR
jgi:hypothetical protein